MFECADIAKVAKPDLGIMLIEGHVDGNVPISLGSIKSLLLPMNNPDL